MFIATTATLLALSTTVLAVTFDGPAPTPILKVFNGISPKTTERARSLPELFRRQQSDDAVCGYIEGINEAAVSCKVGNCLYDDSLSWFGCCTGTVRSDCQIFTTCIDSTAINSCKSDTACASDDYAMACPASTAGVCVTMWSSVEEGMVSQYACDTSSTKVEVLATPTAASGNASGSALSSSPAVSSTDGSLSRPSSTRQATSTTRDDSPRTNTAVNASTQNVATGSQSSAGAMRTAQAVVGAAGGIAGVVALLA